MIDLFYWPTPNGHKITLFLEESGLPYRIIPINIRNGEQFSPQFLNISPNNKIPAIIDLEPNDGGQPISVFESGAILFYLAEKTGRFLEKNDRKRTETMEWLFWQVGGLGPMAGQNHHFVQYAPEKIPYAIERYVKETTRLYTVLNQRLSTRTFIVDDYSIADMACYPWITLYENQLQNLNDFPHVKRWIQSIQARPATDSAYARGNEINHNNAMTESEKNILFNQNENHAK